MSGRSDGSGWGAVVSFFKHRMDKCVPPNVRDCAIVKGEPEETRRGRGQFLRNCTMGAAGVLSGPAALRGFSFSRSFLMPFVMTVMSGMSGYELSPTSGMLARSSAVKTEQNCSLRMLVLAAWSMWTRLDFFNGTTPDASRLLPLMHFHIFLVLPSSEIMSAI